MSERWRSKTRFGKDLNSIEPTGTADILRFVASGYVQARLGAIELHKSDDVMRRGSRLENEAALCGFSCKFGPSISAIISHPSNLSKRRVSLRLYAEHNPQPSTPRANIISKSRWRNYRSSSTTRTPNAPTPQAKFHCRRHFQHFANNGEPSRTAPATYTE